MQYEFIMGAKNLGRVDLHAEKLSCCITLMFEEAYITALAHMGECVTMIETGLGDLNIGGNYANLSIGGLLITFRGIKK